MARLLTSTISILSLLSVVLAQTSSGVTCGAGKLCPADQPCCGPYGNCGTGPLCLGGCDPIHSNALDSCVPAPSCQSKDYELNSLDSVTSYNQYLGDASKTNWVSSGQPIEYQNQILLTMAPNTVGTLLASTAYVWYGKVSATLKTSRTAGVVTAFILLSDVKDEIDFEFVGADLNTAQSNYYFEGITNYDNEKNISLTDDSFNNYHSYEIDWTPDQITWSVNGTSYRTLNRQDTWNATDNKFHFPQTPARIELSLWPAGLSSNGEGTVAWAGGLVDWNSPDVKNAGYFYAMVTDVNVQCYSTPTGANVTGSKSYVYTSPDGLNSSISLTNDATILKSSLGTGTNMSAALPSAAASSEAAAATSASSGLTQSGPGTNGQRGSNSGSSDSGSGSGSGSSSAVSSAPSSTATGIGGFSQGTGTKAASGAQPKSEKVLQGSLFAVLVAVAGMLAM